MSISWRTRADPMALTVLALLSEQPRHPYEMQRVIVERHKDFAVGRMRGLYHAVRRLEREGAIEPVEVTREGRRPERTVYRITDEGREELTVWLSDLLATPSEEHPLFSVAVSFLLYLDVQRVREALERRVVGLEGQSAGLEAALRALRQDLRLPRLFVIEHEYRRAILQAELEWVRSLLGEIRSGEVTWDWESITRHFEEERG